ncbi:MAG: hypothetical protein KF868_01625 [Acidobacteria bacterium]|nr:hypothetical protein [Acidobacteriota bacterium]
MIDKGCKARRSCKVGRDFRRLTMSRSGHPIPLTAPEIGCLPETGFNST